MTGRVVVAGASGFVGRRLVPALAAAGWDVVGGSRDPAAAAARLPDRRWVQLDVDRDEGLADAFAGARVLVYLVHQMAAGGDDLHAREVAAARRVAAAAARAGVQRVVYLGAPMPAGPPSHHLRARLDTGLALAAALPTLELRASMIVGAGSESWTIVRDLALRLPVMILPSWLSTRTQPIAVADVVGALVHGVGSAVTGVFDLPGPEVLTAREILLRVAASRGVRPVMIPVPVLTPSLSSHWLRFVTRADLGIARQLVNGLRWDLVSEGPGYRAHWREPATPFDDAVRQALAEEGEVASAAGRRAERWAFRLSRSA